jgi:hypothetical protein
MSAAGESGRSIRSPSVLSTHRNLLRRGGLRITGSTPRTSLLAAGHAGPVSWAWAPIPGTTSTAARARGLRPMRGDGGRPAKIDRPARAAARAKHVEPRRPRDQCGPDRRRPQHVAARGQLLIPSLDDGLRLRARGRVGNLPLGSYGNVEAPRPHAHGAVLPELGGATTAPHAPAPSPDRPGS